MESLKTEQESTVSELRLKIFNGSWSHYIFIPNTTITTDNPQTTITFSIKQIGTGSYANVFKYKDTFYDRHFVIKRAKKDLSAKELERFKREFEEMKEFSSPYILEVFR